MTHIAAEAAQPPIPPAGDLIAEYIKLRDLKKTSEEKFATWSDAAYGQRMKIIEAQLLVSLDAAGAENIKSEHGTAYKSLVSSVSIADHGEFQRHVIGDEAFHLIDWRANKTAVQEFIEANGAPPPGVTINSIYKVNVRRG